MAVVLVAIAGRGRAAALFVSLLKKMADAAQNEQGARAREPP
jgi:hypothetical protein